MSTCKVACKNWDERTRAKYAQIKIDGNYTKIIKEDKYDSNGGIRVLSSLDTDITSRVKECRPNFWSSLLKRVPVNNILLGELYYPGKPASYVKTGLVNKDKSLRFAGFANENRSTDLPLEILQSEFLAWGLEYASFIRMYCSTYEDEDQDNRDWLSIWGKDKLLDIHLKIVSERQDKLNGGIIEGFVLKDGNLLNWQKIKVEKTIDCFICGWKGGLGKYIGKVGSIIVGVYNDDGSKKVLADVGGFNNRTRNWLSSIENGRRNIDWLIEEKQVVEVAYQYIGSGGKLRHPRFKRFREDKLAEECTVEQDEDLMR